LAASCHAACGYNTNNILHYSLQSNKKRTEINQVMAKFAKNSQQIVLMSTFRHALKYAKIMRCFFSKKLRRTST